MGRAGTGLRCSLGAKGTDTFVHLRKLEDRSAIGEKKVPVK